MFVLSCRGNDSGCIADPEAIGASFGRLVPSSRHLVSKSNTDEMRVFRYLFGETSDNRLPAEIGPGQRALNLVGDELRNGSA